MVAKRNVGACPWCFLTSEVATRTRRFLIFFVAVAFVASGCATQPMPDAFEPPGFWWGLVHGFTIVFSLIGSIFTDCRIYAFPNAGGWYDFGYVLGASAFLGGSGASTHSH